MGKGGEKARRPSRSEDPLREVQQLEPRRDAEAALGVPVREVVEGDEVLAARLLEDRRGQGHGGVVGVVDDVDLRDRRPVCSLTYAPVVCGGTGKRSFEKC